MRSPEERRDEEHKYQSDVWYEVWRSGGNPDEINEDRVLDNYYQGADPSESAHDEILHQKHRFHPDLEDIDHDAY